MSVEYRSLEQPATIATDPDEYARTSRFAFTGRVYPGRAPPRKPVSLSIRSSPNARHPLPARIERVHLRARIAALERELTIRDRQRRELITQYERELEGRQDHDCSQKQRHRGEEDDRSGRSDRSDFTQARQSRQTRTKRTGLLQRVLDRWHQHRHSK
ncbi:hypothetical protein [Natrialba asiatica]|uniref:Uncharacterized protein n=1 Tax=Natrialba asiatica (strain ATCC 700177 / DSM 12278 / JCM 9576 / FERM P-10747 / NBRC 102637 / 172P1) TaxID=29540 RepID=M0AJP7_NATA1|nr:hypothetical protein [Natrialba asiatica]ELY98117.1 hypothetical protein C481_19315 [Natrialba asiatica DSM 12278]